MPHANRHYPPNQLWHITHRCHKQKFLRKFARDRRPWMYWLYAARKRFRLSGLKYMVTSNHVRLLVRDRGEGEGTTGSGLPVTPTPGPWCELLSERAQDGLRGAFWAQNGHSKR